MTNETLDKNPDFMTADKTINVKKIMQDIQKRIDEKKKSGVLRDKDVAEIDEMELLAYPDFQDIPNIFESHLYTKEKMDHSNFDVGEDGERGFVKKILGKMRHILSPLTRFWLRPHLKEFRFIDQLNKQYIALLHNSTNNLILELTKLKIEEETLKTKIKTLEDKMEFLEKRQRFVEKKVFK